MKKNQKRLLTLAMMVAATPLYAASINEVEANHPLQSAQYLSAAGGEVTISAAIGVPGATETVATLFGSTTVPASSDDLDFFSFYAQAGDVVTLDIDNGAGGQQSVDTTMAVFNSSGTMLRMNDDAESYDAGSTSLLDSRIDDFVVPATGIYHVGVSSYPRYFQDGGTVDTTSSPGGDYTLRIAGASAAPVKPSVKKVSISVKPGSNDRAPINPKSKGKVKFAVLSANDFNAMEIDPSSMTFGATGNEASLSKCNNDGQDVNGDGLLDLVCHYENQAAGFRYSDVEGVVRGKTRKGVAFEGRGLLKVVPTKTK